MGDTSSSSPFGQKRSMDQTSGMNERHNQMKIKRQHQTLNDISDSDMNDSIDNMTSDDIFLPQAMQPQVTINESPRYDATSVKRENSDVTVSQPQSPSSAFRATTYRELLGLYIDIKFWMIFYCFLAQKTQTQTRCKALRILTTSRNSPTTICRCRMKADPFTWIFQQVRT